MSRGNQRELARQKNLSKQKQQAKGKKEGDPKKRMAADADILRQKQAAADARKAEQNQSGQRK
ncbi:SERF-like protein [Lachancea thermotolerans]|uniref:KLTH0H15730p n=1 Tax=Lachancea thermotolerans (strain ATCC 56472 / CBS 6340 / NRRL Y-8284) TaxID=559295 RepID=C5E3R5_LACTC|nr:KLTH0H15730p [Lachancea thermotolerans CBS 6340]CAR30676.1 KLTH0H15730p [Lachancea thermotolerans CBS 6340]